MFPTPLCVRPFNSVPLRVTFFTLNENTSLMSKFKPFPQSPIFTIRSSIADVATTVNRKEFESLKKIVEQQTQEIENGTLKEILTSFGLAFIEIFNQPEAVAFGKIIYSQVYDKDRHLANWRDQFFSCLIKSNNSSFLSNGQNNYG